jgi:hypothetical protein
MIIRDLKKFIPSIEAHYPHYNNILDLQHFTCNQRGYFSITTKIKQFRHLRIVRDNVAPKRVYDFNLGDIKKIMQFSFGPNSTGIYVLPKKSNTVCGLPTEHIFSYDEIYKDFNSVLHYISEHDKIIKSVIEYDAKVEHVTGTIKIMETSGKKAFKYCNYKTENESIFNFYSLLNAKNVNMDMPSVPMVVPIHADNPDNSNIKILPWPQNNIPDLMNLYNYDIPPSNPPTIQKIIRDELDKKCSR